MADDNQCPVCLRAAELESLGNGVDGRRVACELCGEFLVSRTDRINLQSPRVTWNRSHASALVREQFILRSSPFWLHDGTEPGEVPDGEDRAHLGIIELLSRWPRTVPERIDRMLCNLARRSPAGGAIVDVGPNDLSFGFAESKDELRFFLQALPEYNFAKLSEEYQKASVSVRKLTLTAKGWERFSELTRATSAPQNPVFVAMWYATGTQKSEMDDAYVMGIKAAIEDAGYQATRSDLEEHNDDVMDRVLAEIRMSPFVVADCTGHRNGVYFEAGFARGLGISVIHTCRADSFEGVHFDTKQLQHVVWSSPEELRKRLLNRILGTIGAGPGRRTDPS